MKIVNIKIDGYKNLIDCNYALGDFNVLIGANNSGKSNFLEVFSFLNILLMGSEEVKERLLDIGMSINGSIQTTCITYDENLIPLKEDRRRNAYVEIEFTEEIDEEIYKYIYFIRIKFGELFKDKGFIEQEYLKYKNIKSSGPMKTVFERENNIITKINGIQSIAGTEATLSIINKIKDIKDKFSYPIQIGIDCVFLICKTPVLYSSSNEMREAIKISAPIIKNGRIVSLALIDEIDSILKSEDNQIFKDILKSTLNVQEIQCIRIGSEYKDLLVKFYKKSFSSIRELSDGTLIVINIITYLFSNKYPVIAIEEVENSIHPTLLNKLVDLIKNTFYDTQVILTTHSPVLLNMVKLKEVSIISNKDEGRAYIEQVKDKKDLIKKLSGPFSSFSDIFYYTEE